MKQKTKEKIIKILDNISNSATENLSLLRGLGEFILMQFLLLIFVFFFSGIHNELFNGYFEIFVAFGIFVIAILNIRITFNNGFLGLGNIIYFALAFYGSIMTTLSGESNNLLSAGTIIIKIIWFITVGAVIYKFFRERKIKQGKKKK